MYVLFLLLLLLVLLLPGPAAAAAASISLGSPGNSPISASRSASNCDSRPTDSWCDASPLPAPRIAASRAASAAPLSHAACTPAPVSQSPHTPTRAAASRMHGTPGEFSGSAAPHSWQLRWQCDDVGCGSVKVWECGSVEVWECGSVEVQGRKLHGQQC